MKIKGIFKNYDLSEFDNLISKLKDYDGEHKNLLTSYLKQLILLKVLESYNLFELQDQQKYSFKEYFTKDLWQDENLDLEKLFFELYDVNHKVRYIHFSTDVKKIELSDNYNLYSFIRMYFNHIIFEENLYISKKELSRILNLNIL